MSTFPPTDDHFFYKPFRWQTPHEWKPYDSTSDPVHFWINYRDAPKKEPTMDDKLRAAALTLADLFNVVVVRSVVVDGAVYLRAAGDKYWVMYREGASGVRLERSVHIKAERIPALVAAGLFS